MKFLIRTVYEIEYNEVINEYPQLHLFDIYENDNKYCIISINSLEDLIRLKDELKEEIIIRNSYFDKILEIMIYDGYIE